MIEIELLQIFAQSGLLASLCGFLLWKDMKKDTKIIETLNKISIILDERLPRK